MWKRKELKKNARRSIRQNYWRMVSVCFLIALLTASYPLATAFLGVHPLSHIDTISNLHQTFETETTSQILEETATTTAENFAFSRDLLTEMGVDPSTDTVAVVTNDFHIARAKLLAARNGYGHAAGVPAELPWVHLQINYYLREAFAMVKSFLLD